MSKLKVAVEGPGPSRWAWALGATLLAAAGLATLRDADRARRPVTPSALASEALDRSLKRGSGDPSVRQALVDLRRRLGQHPLDTATRVAYASLLLGLSRSVEETHAAAFHADLAAELSPVTVPVVRASAVILARTGDTERSTRRIRRMFEYDAESAADLLVTLAAGLQPAEIESSIADTPEAWIAWLTRLHRDDRGVEAYAWLARAFERWPNHPETLERVAAKSVRRGEWEALSDLFAVEREIPERSSTARLIAFRALARAREGNHEAARTDSALALRLGEGDPRVRISAGDAHAAMGQFDQARRLWNHAHFSLQREGATATHKRVLLRLAHLEDDHGSPAAALRLWRSILELDPEHREARQRVEDLTGFSP